MITCSNLSSQVSLTQTTSNRWLLWFMIATNACSDFEITHLWILKVCQASQTANGRAHNCHVFMAIRLPLVGEGFHGPAPLMECAYISEAVLTVTGIWWRALKITIYGVCRCASTRYSCPGRAPAIAREAPISGSDLVPASFYQCTKGVGCLRRYSNGLVWVACAGIPRVWCGQQLKYFSQMVW